ncbi:MAG: hypothetical protein ACOC0E_09925 [Spirochaetota bacterium]
MSDQPAALDNRVVILNGFSDQEIIAVMNVVKSIYANADMAGFVKFVQAVEDHPDATDFSRRLLRVIAAAKQTEQSKTVSTGDLIFARTTENSLQMKLADLIEDMSEDHDYLKKNPPETTTPPGTGSAGSQAPGPEQDGTP